MTLYGVIAVILCYFTQGSTFQNQLRQANCNQSATKMRLKDSSILRNMICGDNRRLPRQLQKMQLFAKVLRE